MPTTSTITIEAEDAPSRDKKLDQATSQLRGKATACGILVTRIDFSTFTVALSPDIPFGLTREIDLL